MLSFPRRKVLNKVKDFDLAEFPLNRFSNGDRVFVWKKRQEGETMHGSYGMVKSGRSGKYVETRDGNRFYWDSGAWFMSEEEFSVFEIMDG